MEPITPQTEDRAHPRAMKKLELAFHFFRHPIFSTIVYKQTNIIISLKTRTLEKEVLMPYPERTKTTPHSFRFLNTYNFVN